MLKKLGTQKYTEFKNVAFAVTFAFPSLIKTSIFDKLTKLEGKFLQRYKQIRATLVINEIIPNIGADKANSLESQEKTQRLTR